MGKTLDISLKQINNSEFEFTLKAENSFLKPFYEKALIEVQKNANIKGFRKGKVPRQMVEKIYKPQIQADSEVDFVNDKFNEYTKENNVAVLSQPKLNDINRTEQGYISYTITFESIGDFLLPDYKDFNIYEPVHAVTEEEIENEIYKLVRANGTFEDAEQILDYDYVVGVKLKDKHHTSDSHVPEEQETNIYLNDDKVEKELKELLLNAKVGDNLDFESVHGDHTHQYIVIVTDIQKLIPAEFNNELVERLTNGKFLTTEDLRENIGYDIQEQWDNESRMLMEEQIVEDLVSKVEMTLPDSLIERTGADLFNYDYQKSKLNYDSLNNEMKTAINAMYAPKAESFIKWNRLKDKLVEKETIIIEDFDIQKYVDEEVERTKGDEEKVRAELYNNADFIYNLKSKKLMDLLLDFATTNEISFDEYQAIKQNKLNPSNIIENNEQINLVDMGDEIVEDLNTK